MSEQKASGNQRSLGRWGQDSNNVSFTKWVASGGFEALGPLLLHMQQLVWKRWSSILSVNFIESKA